MEEKNDKQHKDKKPYVTKEERARFIHWYLEHYGLNVELKKNNSRKLSEHYQRDTGVLIPKISIYRWLNRIAEDEKYTIAAYAKEFIDPTLITKPKKDDDDQQQQPPKSD